MPTPCQQASNKIDEPVVGNMMDLHRQMPLSDYKLIAHDKSIERVFQDFADEAELLNLSSYILGDYFLLGEACHKPGTQIRMSDGTERSIENIKIGDEVFTHTDEVHKVTHPMVRLVNGDIYEIHANGLQESLKVTGEHPVYVVKKSDYPCVMGQLSGGNPKICVREDACPLTTTSYYKDNGVKYGKHTIARDCYHWQGTPTPEFIPAKDLKVGDYVVIPRTETPDRSTTKEERDYAKFLGYYLSEGSISINHSQSINLSNTDTDIKNEMFVLMSAALPEGGTEPGIAKHRGDLSTKDCYNVRSYNKELVYRVLKDCNRYSDKKKLSIEIMQWPRSLQIEMLKGYILGDGWVDDGAVRFASVSKDLISQLTKILDGLGCDYSLLTRTDLPCPRTKLPGKDLYQVKLTKQASLIFKEPIGKLSHIKEPGRVCTYNRVFDNFILRPVTKITKENYNGPVYNLEVEGDHSYVANKIATHNCLHKNWDPVDVKWKDLALLPPEKVEVRRTYLTRKPLLLLHVDSELKRLVNSADPINQAITKQMDIDLVDQIKGQDRIVLPPKQCYLFANKTSESDLRGTSILKRGLYALLLKYKLRVLHNAYLDRGVAPIKIWKLGDSASKWIPTKAHFDALRNSLMALANDPDGNLIFHFGLNFEAHDLHSKWQDLLSHYDWCDRELMVSLFGNQSLMQSQPVSYSNSNISVRVILSRYQMIRSQLELIWKNEVFRPMAEARGYWVQDSTGSMGRAPSKEKNGKYYYLDVPQFKWSKLNLLDDTAQKQFLMRLRERGEIPHKTIADIFDFDSEELKAQLKREEGSLIDPAYQAAKTKAAVMPEVMPQVFEGEPSGKWVLPKGNPAEEAKIKKERKKDNVGKPPAPEATGPLAQAVPEKPFPNLESTGPEEGTKSTEPTGKIVPPPL